ncbi:MAG: hypothetical protein ACREIV_07395, partial [Planctomycetaceae bacterium]
MSLDQDNRTRRLLALRQLHAQASAVTSRSGPRPTVRPAEERAASNREIVPRVTDEDSVEQFLDACGRPDGELVAGANGSDNVTRLAFERPYIIVGRADDCDLQFP